MERHARDTKILNEYGRRHREATARAGGWLERIGPPWQRHSSPRQRTAFA